MYIYERQRFNKRTNVECSSIEEAKSKAVKDWATGSFLPLHISDSSGNQIYHHSKLRRFLKKKTGIGKWEAKY